MSEIWAYFDKTADNKSKCKLCKTDITRSQGSTSGMWTHLKSAHIELYKKLKSGTAEGSGNVNLKSYIKLSKFKF